jgi:hypothetical protein
MGTYDTVRRRAEKEGRAPEIFFDIFIGIIQASPEIEAGKPPLGDTSRTGGKAVAYARQILPGGKCQNRKGHTVRDRHLVLIENYILCFKNHFSLYPENLSEKPIRKICPENLSGKFVKKNYPGNLS